jgi:hypothetical protein
MKTIALLLALAFATPAAAAPMILGCHKQSCVTATSKTSTRTASGPVRDGKVRLPGGTWVDCAGGPKVSLGDCRDTLRKKTVDFWYEQKLNN